MEKKEVEIEITVTHTVTVPKDWTEEEITFFYNESAHCISNELEDMVKDKKCYCDVAKVKVVNKEQ